MKKKLLLGLPMFVAAMTLTSALASASGFQGHDGHDKYGKKGSEVVVTNENEAYVEQSVVATSNTGANKIEGAGEITTGDATSVSYGEIQANSNTTTIEANEAKKVTVNNNNKAKVKQDVLADSNTGANSINENDGKKDGKHKHHFHKPVVVKKAGKIKTGDAYSDATAVTKVNSNVTEIK